MPAKDPVVQAEYQSQPKDEATWNAIMRRILNLATSTQGKQFATQPKANRFEAILEAAVPSRHNPTHEKVLAIVNALVDTKAIRADEGGEMYNALLHRVAKYNSPNVQHNLDKLVIDVKEAIARKERQSDKASLSSLVTLNAFLATLPANIERGQQNYLSFISALRIMVTEIPQSEVYQAGPQYFFQTSKHGAQIVNLTKAFENLKSLWAVKAPGIDRSTISALLTPNTRLLLLLIAPFTDADTIPRSYYLGHLLSLYRETLGHAHVDEETFNEITAVSRALGQENPDNLQSTLNFLLTNKKQTVPQHFRLTPEEERILRYVQQAVSLYLMQDNATPTSALDRTAANFEPSFYSANRFFINKLMDYFHRAAAISPDYFTNAVLNPHWLPPEGFFTGDFDLPDPVPEQNWTPIESDEEWQAATKAAMEDDYQDDSLSELGAAAPPLRSPTPEVLLNLGARPKKSPQLGDIDWSPSLPLKNNAFDSLVRDLEDKWQPDLRPSYKKAVQKYKQRVEHLHKRRRKNDEDSDLEGSGNPFAYLRPQGNFGK